MDKTVTIYSTPTCHFCKMTKAYFAEHGITYTEHDVANDPAMRAEMLDRSGQMGVPVIFVGDPSNPSGESEMIIGFDKKKLDELFAGQSAPAAETNSPEATVV